jgi:hypothetical protein
LRWGRNRGCLEVRGSWFEELRVDGRLEERLEGRRRTFQSPTFKSTLQPSAFKLPPSPNPQTNPTKHSKLQKKKSKIDSIKL